MAGLASAGPCATLASINTPGEYAMPSLTTLAADADSAAILAALEQDGACIVAGALAPERLARVNAETDPWVQRSDLGRDDFFGRSTSRTGALVARSPACCETVLDPRILDAARAFLGPWCHRIQLHLTQIIRLLPGQGRQVLHRDRLAWGGWLPHSIEPQFNTIWALTDFTDDNGATQVVPGSHRWDPERKATPEEITQAAMPAGSVLIYTGTVIHGGGENRSDAERRGMNITYCLSWLRQEENQFLACPPEIARELAPELQELLGYTMANYALGYYTDPAGEIGEVLPPEFALGRKPRKETRIPTDLPKPAAAD